MGSFPSERSGEITVIKIICAALSDPMHTTPMQKTHVKRISSQQSVQVIGGKPTK
jgi:hypothetical protein